MTGTPKEKRIERLRPWSDEALQEAKMRALRRIKDIEIVEREREERDEQKA